MWDFFKRLFKYSPVGVITEAIDAATGGKPSGLPSPGSLIGRGAAEGVKALANSDVFQNVFAKYAGTGLTDAEKQANAFNAAEAQAQRDWETQMSNTAYQRQVSDMQAAGVNPALAMSASANGASTPSGSVASSVSPGSGLGIIEAISSLVSLPAQIRLLNAQANSANALAGKTNAEIPWVDRLNGAEEESRRSASALNHAKISEINAELKKKEFECKKLAAEAKTEETKQLYNKSASMLANAHASQIAALLPYQKLLMSAQTSAQKVEASLKLVQKGFFEKLYSDEYINALIDSAAADAGIKLNDKEKSDARNHIMGYSDDVNRGPFETIISRAGAVLAGLIPGASNPYD